LGTLFSNALGSFFYIGLPLHLRPRLLGQLDGLQRAEPLHQRIGNMPRASLTWLPSLKDLIPCRQQERHHSWIA
jgi:hypothetical protein